MTLPFPLKCEVPCFPKNKADPSVVTCTPFMKILCATRFGNGPYSFNLLTPLKI